MGLPNNVNTALIIKITPAIMQNKSMSANLEITSIAPITIVTIDGRLAIKPFL